MDFLSPLKNALGSALDWAKKAIGSLFNWGSGPTMQTAGATGTGLGANGGLFQGASNYPAVVKTKPISHNKTTALAGNTNITVQVAKTDADPQQIARAVNQALQQHQMAQESRHRRRLVD